MKFEDTLIAITTETSGTIAYKYDKVNKITNVAAPIYEVKSVEFAFKNIPAIPNGVQAVINTLYSVENILISGSGSIESVQWPNNILETVAKLDIQKGFTGSSFKTGLPKNLNSLDEIKDLRLHANVEYFNEDAIRELLARCGNTSTVRIYIVNEDLLRMALRAITQHKSNWQNVVEIMYNGNVFCLNPFYGHFRIKIDSADQVKSDFFDYFENLRSIKIEATQDVIDAFDMFGKMLEKSLETLEHLMILNVKLAKYEDTLRTIDAYISSLRSGGKSFRNLKSLSVSTILITETDMDGIIEPMHLLIRQEAIEVVVSFVPQIDDNETFEITIEEDMVPADLCKIGDWKKFDTDERVGCNKPISENIRNLLSKGDTPKWVSELFIDAIGTKAKI